MMADVTWAVAIDSILPVEHDVLLFKKTFFHSVLSSTMKRGLFLQ
jgi:hypothetical protein